MFDAKVIDVWARKEGERGSGEYTNPSNSKGYRGMEQVYTCTCTDRTIWRRSGGDLEVLFNIIGIIEQNEDSITT